MEEIENYNMRVKNALKSFDAAMGTKIIIDKGREWNEKSVVLIENGIYKGFGYVEADVEVENTEQANLFIQHFKHNADVQRILNGWERQLMKE